MRHACAPLLSPTVAQVGTVCTCGYPFLKFASSVPNLTAHSHFVRGQTGGNGRCHNEQLKPILFACSFFFFFTVVPSWDIGVSLAIRLGIR